LLLLRKWEVLVKAEATS